MACDCDQLNNRLRDLEARVRALETCTGCGRGGRGTGNGGNTPPIDIDAIAKKVLERLFRHKNWISVIECLEFIIKGKVS